MSDLFHDQVLDAFLDQVFMAMARCYEPQWFDEARRPVDYCRPRHIFPVLTKRPRRLRTYLTPLGARASTVSPDPTVLQPGHLSLNPYLVEYRIFEHLTASGGRTRYR